MREQNLMLHLKQPNGDITEDPVEMRKLAMDFYENLFSAGTCNPSSVEEMHEGLPMLRLEQVASLETCIMMEEMSKAVQEMPYGCSSVIDGLPSEFYKSFWGLLGKDLWEVFMDCFNSGMLPLS